MKLRTSLRVGGMGRRATSVLAAAALAAGLTVGWQVTTPSPAAAAGETTDLVFLVDGSGSIDPADWQIQKDGYSVALQDTTAFPRDGSIAVAVVQWSFATGTERTRVEVPLTVLDSLATVQTIIGQIQAMTQIGDLTNPGDAVRAGTDLLLADGESPAGSDWILCMSTDGVTNSGEDLGSATAYAAGNGVDKYSVVAIEDPGVADADELREHYGPHVFGGGSVTIAGGSAELANIIIGGCIGEEVQLRALEVNQSVQDWHNSVPLVTDKPTAVRAFVEVPGGADDELVVGRLFGRRGGADLPGSPLLAENVGGQVVAEPDVVARRGVLTDSLNFVLPDSWRSGTVELEFEAAGAPVLCQEPSGPGAEPGGDCVVTVSFQDEVTPEVAAIAVRYTSGGTTFEPSPEELAEQMFRLQSILPVAEVDFRTDSMGNYPSTPSLVTVNTHLAAKRTMDIGNGLASAASRYYGALGGLGGGRANDIPGTVASGFLNGVGAIDGTGRYRNVVAHEYGHVLGRHHAVDPSLPPVNGLLRGYCGSVASMDAPGHTPFETVGGNVRPVLGPLSSGADNESWGLDNRMLDNHTQLAVVDPRQTFELMSYCDGGAQGLWISQFTYEGLIGSFPAGGASASGDPGDFVLVTGNIDFDADTAELAPVLEATGSPPTPVPGDYRVQLLDSSGVELAGADFEPEVMDDDPLTPQIPAGPPVGLVNVPLPKPAGSVASVRILHDGDPIGSLIASANPPAVGVMSPAGGETFTDPSVTLEWQGSDPDGDPLAYTVQYSTDDGSTWETLTVNTEATTLTVPRSDLPATTTARLRVIASDGVNVAIATSNQFAVANNAPFVATNRSVDGRIFASVQNIHLLGAGLDTEDGTLAGTSLTWSSDVDGMLGTGRELTVNALDLTEGTHEVTLTANDGAGATAAATQTIRVFRVAPPRPGIEVDAGGPYSGQEGAAVSLAGTVSDPDQLGFTVEWTAVPIGGTDPGASCQFADPTTPSTTVSCTDDGTYLLTLTGRDSVSPRTTSHTTTLHLSNVAPVVSISTPGDGDLSAVDTPVEVVAPFTDLGSNDTHTCTVDFGDGTPAVAGTVDQSPGSGTCTASHTFTGVGPHEVQVMVTDDNGGSDAATATVVAYLPGDAFAIQATGLVTIEKTPHATCPPDQSLTLAQIDVAIATVNGLTANCTVASGAGETVASTSVEQASLLGGLITISGIESTCVANVDGITRTSSVGTINGIEIGGGSGSISIPLVAQVFYNETTTGPGGQLVQNAIRVQTLLGQQIILGGCRLG